MCSAAGAFGYAKKNWAREPLVLLTVASVEWSPLLAMNLWMSPVARIVVNALLSAQLVLGCFVRLCKTQHNRNNKNKLP